MNTGLMLTDTPIGALPPREENWLEIERVFRGMVARDATEAQIDALIMACRASRLNPVLQHAALVDGRVYITHKGLWHLAHLSGQLDGIEVLEEGDTGSHWTARVAIWRKDMRLPFTFAGRYPKGGRNAKYGPEMALARAESMALRRAFDVPMPTYDEADFEEGNSDAGNRPRADIREVPRPAPAALPAPAEVAPAAPAFDFAAWSADLATQAADGVATRAIADEIKAAWEGLSDAEAEAIDLWFRQLRDARKAAKPGVAAPAEPDSPTKPRHTRPAAMKDEALLAVVVNAAGGEEARATAARTFLARATDAEALFARVAQLTVLDFPAPILDVLVAEQRERLGLPDDDAGRVIEALADPDEVVG